MLKCQHELFAYPKHQSYPEIIISMSMKKTPSKILKHSMFLYFNTLKHFWLESGTESTQLDPHSLKCMSSNQLSMHLLGTVPFHPLNTLVNVYVDLVVFTRIAGTS